MSPWLILVLLLVLGVGLTALEHFGLPDFSSRPTIVLLGEPRSCPCGDPQCIVNKQSPGV
jgi:hypothetical protein